MSESDSGPTPVLPALVSFGTLGALAFGFGAGAGWRSFSYSTAYKELVEKFPDAPSMEAEAMARRGATRALAVGTGLAAMMGVGAVAVARSYGVKTIEDFAEEARRWLPSREALQGEVDKLEPLNRRFQQSTVGVFLADKAKGSASARATAVG